MLKIDQTLTKHFTTSSELSGVLCVQYVLDRFQCIHLWLLFFFRKSEKLTAGGEKKKKKGKKQCMIL